MTTMNKAVKGTKNKIDITKRGFKTKTEEKAFYTQKQGIMLQKNANDISNLSFEQFYHSYYEEHLQNCAIEKSTLGKIKGMFKNHILPFYGTLKVKDISFQDTLQSFEVWKIKLIRPLKVAIELNKCLQHAVEYGIISKNPVDLWVLHLWVKKDRRMKGNQQIEKLFYTPDESYEFIQKLKATNDISKIAIFLLFINLGLRKCELLALQWQDIDLQNKKIRIHQSLGTDEFNKAYIKVPRSNCERTLDIDEETLQALFKWQELQAEQLKLQNFKHQGEKQFIFLNNKNTFYNNSNLNTWLKKFQTQHGLKLVSVHDLRQSCATRIYYQTKDVECIQHFLGHTDINTTIDLYIHCIPELGNILVKPFNQTV